MSLFIGFGSTEADFEAAEERAFRESFRDACANNDAGYVTDELVAELRKWVDRRAGTFRDVAEQYKTSDNHPDRYSSYRAAVLHDASHVAAIMKFTHINRKHAFSPDGWGALMTERCFFIHILDANKL